MCFCSDLFYLHWFHDESVTWLLLHTLWVSGNSQLCAKACFCSDPLHLHWLHTELVTWLLLNMETYSKRCSVT